MKQMKNIKNWILSHLPSKRRLIQLYAALLFNANLKGFGNGRIFKGPIKNICTPGLNCYSCPGATGACPLGALQNALAASDKRAPFYVLGILMLYGLFLGRWICGFLCPFGLIQDLLHKIKTPKLKKGRLTKILSCFKYVVLVLFVVVLPLLYVFRNFPLPGFCKYICPAGTLEGAFGLLANEVNSGYFSMLGPIFTWKFMLLVSFIVGTIFIYRLFCRFLCPLGAIYGLFNKIAFFGIKLEKSKCIDCGLCLSKCKMDIRHVGDAECISCGECIEVCPTNAIRWKGGRVYLAPNEIEGVPEEEAVQIAQEHNERIKKRNKILQIVMGSSMAVLLAGALIYCNFIDQEPTVTPPVQESDESTTDGGEEQPDPIIVGNRPGNLCPTKDVTLLDGEDTVFNIESQRGRVMIVNFWFTTCSGCVKEMPGFARIAEEYADEVTVLALHADMPWEDPVQFIADSDWDKYNILFGMDAGNEYFSILGGADAYPHTVIVDENGIVVYSETRDITYEELKEIVDSILTK